MTPALVIFDCDGVLVDTEPTTEQVMSANFARYGLNLTPHEIGALFVGGTMRGAGIEARKLGAPLPHNWIDEINSEVADALRPGVPVFEGLFDLLDRLDAAGIATAIASNGPMTKMEVSLAPSGLLSRFAGRIYSAVSHAPKPDPAMLLHACADVGTTPERALMIDDTPTGTNAAKAAGIPAFGFLPSGDATNLEATGARVVRSHAEIVRLLGL